MHRNGELHLMKDIFRHLSCLTVFDVGANIGEWTELALRINPNLNIHCFEPSSITFKKLKSRNFKGNIIYNNFGLSSTTKQKKLYIFGECDGKNSLHIRSGLEEGWGLKEQQTTETVKLETLDKYCNQYGIQEIDFMKLDVEGHEFEVLRGATEMISKFKIKRIQFEYGRSHIASRVFLKDFF